MNQVSSELYGEFDYETDLKPSVNLHNVVSKFPFVYPLLAPQVDPDGDLIVTRKLYNNVIEIEHRKSTTIPLVGLQVWRGALLLADWLLYTGETLPKSSKILELGSGTGLTSIIASIFAPVICTDVDKGDILKLLKANVQRNKSTSKNSILVTEFDFAMHHSKDTTNADIGRVLDDIKIILAADVIYDDNLTEDFVKTLEFFQLHSKVESIYVALEKRYVFTIADCDVCAPCYEFFLQCLQKVKDASFEVLPLDFPQYFQYDRVKELTLLKITFR
ncbi:hypothetical protein FQA39_LY09242 [Lamprigera yunnana]|nr:hypothetical protein FQA39_LY09242 [Lamprigera yunnana]